MPSKEAKPVKEEEKKPDKDLKEKKNAKNNKNEEEKKNPVEDNSKKREKKVFDLPGQKRGPPEERDPLRIFYESLYEQLPGSEMAEFWMMESGLLPLEVAKKVYEKKQKKNQQQRLNSPIKAITTVKKTDHSVTVKKNTAPTVSPAKTKSLPSNNKTVLKQSKKLKLRAEDRSDNDDDDDFVPLAKKKVKK